MKTAKSRRGPESLANVVARIIHVLLLEQDAHRLDLERNTDDAQMARVHRIARLAELRSWLEGERVAPQEQTDLESEDGIPF